MSPREERYRELLLEQALYGLDVVESAELEHLREEFPGIDPREYAETATAIQLAAVNETSEPLPAALRGKIEQDATAWLASSREAPRPEPVRPAAPRSSWAAWAVAAASLIFAVATWVTQVEPRRTSAERRDLLLTQAPDVVRIDWNENAAGPYGGLDGDVVWSEQRQEGYMLLAGLPANDPTVSQYQLWIVDPFNPLDDKPIDGGVFDIPRDGGPVVVPIDAKLAVRGAQAFAVTVERPGGVVVSDQSKVAAVAIK